jgi:hypothetical protein
MQAAVAGAGITTITGAMEAWIPMCSSRCSCSSRWAAGGRVVVCGVRGGRFAGEEDLGTPDSPSYLQL